VINILLSVEQVYNLYGPLYGLKISFASIISSKYTVERVFLRWFGLVLALRCVLSLFLYLETLLLYTEESLLDLFIASIQLGYVPLFNMGDIFCQPEYQTFTTPPKRHLSSS
jgi:hypothetical protein